MKFGVREICDVVFKAKETVTIGNAQFVAGQPVLYIDTAKTSTLESAATTVYAQGGKGNSRLLAWEGEKTLTFTVEDAMLSPLGFSVLTGAGILEAGAGEDAIQVHTVLEKIVSASGDEVTFTGADLDWHATDNPSIQIYVGTDAAIYGTVVDENGSAVRVLATTGTVTGTNPIVAASGVITVTFTGADFAAGERVVLDMYVTKTSKAQELQIDAGTFGGYYYVEASTLFRDQLTGEDLAAEIILPKVKIQSNFTFAMASTGDPSTFSFVMDAFPATTAFSTNKVLCAIQIVGGDALV